MDCPVGEETLKNRVNQTRRFKVSSDTDRVLPDAEDGLFRVA